MKHYRITKTIAAALLSLACSTACAQQGAWSGDLNVMGTKLPLVFNFSADGCTLDSPAQGAKDITAITAKTILLLLRFIIFNPKFPYNLILLVVVGKAYLNACN